MLCLNFQPLINIFFLDEAGAQKEWFGFLEYFIISSSRQSLHLPLTTDSM